MKIPRFSAVVPPPIDAVTRYLPATPVATLERAREIALAKGIRYAYVGNVPDHPGNHTYCPKCKKAVVRRTGMFVLEKNLKGGACASCMKGVTSTRYLLAQKTLKRIEDPIRG